MVDCYGDSVRICARYCMCVSFVVVYRCSLFLLDQCKHELVATVFDSDLLSERVSTSYAPHTIFLTGWPVVLPLGMPMGADHMPSLSQHDHVQYLCTEWA